jgi:glycosyltransferase involved in cell wall biosynthesis
MFASRPSLKIVATILARDEEDIIGAAIEHHLAHGVTRFVVTDNGSRDRTREIVSRYAEVAELIDEPGDDHRQSEWVTRMARLACKLEPDWIVHLDADELWCGLGELRAIDGPRFASTRVYLHPPTGQPGVEGMSRYLDLDAISLPGECKVGHRPDPGITITHGNHGFGDDGPVAFTDKVWRHHYPVRSYPQFRRKAVDGHLSLMRRNAICERWERWYNLHLENKLEDLYNQVCREWQEMSARPNAGSLRALLDMWATPEVVRFFEETGALPAVGQWPRSKT